VELQNINTFVKKINKIYRNYNNKWKNRFMNGNETQYTTTIELY